MSGRVGLAFIVAVVLTGCETLAPEASGVRIASKPEDVAGCKILGTVESSPPYVGPNDGVNQLKNKTAGLGGNVLFLTSTGALRGKSGMAYACDNVKPKSSEGPRAERLESPAESEEQQR